jgi:cell division protein FtsB
MILGIPLNRKVALLRAVSTFTRRPGDETVEEAPMTRFGLILIIILAAFVLLGIIIGVVLLMTRKSTASSELAEVREEMARLHDEVEQLRDEVRHRKTGPTAPGSTDIQSH